jgi:outer membrane protein TolC
VISQPGTALKEEAVRERQDLKAIQASTLIAERKKTQTQCSFGPSLGLSGSYLKNEAPSVKGSFDTHELTLSLKIPVFDGGRRIRALSEARANLEASKQRERAKTLEVATQVDDALGRLRATQAQFEAGRAQRKLGAEVARVEHLKLDQGSGRVEDYLAARAQELGGETAYWQGLYAFQTAVDYRNFVTGKGVNHD